MEEVSNTIFFSLISLDPNDKYISLPGVNTPQNPTLRDKNAAILQGPVRISQ